MRKLGCVVLGALAALVVRCGGWDTVTGPPPPQPDPIVSGGWRGTITFGGQVCVPETVDVTVSQNRHEVEFEFGTVCYGKVSFSGELAGPSLSGRLWAPSDGPCPVPGEPAQRTTLPADAQGSASASQIHMSSGSFRSPFGGSCERPGVVLELAR